METIAVDDHNDRPWEQPGQVRRDCESHRADFLQVLGAISFACGALAFGFGVTGLIGLPLGLAVSWLAGRDLASMSAGTMDPSGARQTEKAQDFAFGGWVFSLISWLMLLGLWILMGWLAQS